MSDDINKGMYETCMEQVNSNSKLSADMAKSKKTCVCFGNKTEFYYKKHQKEFTDSKEKFDSQGLREPMTHLLEKMNDYAMKECGMSDDQSSGGMLSKSSLAELKKECPEFITNMLPNDLLSQSKCACNKLINKDREKLIVIENRLGEIQEIIAEAERTGVISNSNALLKEGIELKNQSVGIFIDKAKKCKAGL